MVNTIKFNVPGPDGEVAQIEMRMSEPNFEDNGEIKGTFTIPTREVLEAFYSLGGIPIPGEEEEDGKQEGQDTEGA